MPYGKTTIINNPYDVNKHVPYGVTKNIYTGRLLCLCLITLHSSIMLENVEVKECRGKEVRRRT